MRLDLTPTTFNGSLSYLTEECGEVLQTIGKYGRFGANPTDNKTGIEYNNLDDLQTELAHLERAIKMVQTYLVK